MLPDRGTGVGLRAEAAHAVLIERLVSLLDVRQEVFHHQVLLQAGEILLLPPAHLAPPGPSLPPRNSSSHSLCSNTLPGLETGESRKSYLFQKLVKVAVTHANVTYGHLFLLEGFITNRAGIFWTHQLLQFLAEVNVGHVNPEILEKIVAFTTNHAVILRYFDIFHILGFLSFRKIFNGHHWHWIGFSNLASEHHLLLWEVNGRNVEIPENIVDLGVSDPNVGEEGGLDSEDVVADTAGVS